MEDIILQGKKIFLSHHNKPFFSWNKPQLSEHMSASSCCFVVLEKEKNHLLLTNHLQRLTPLAPPLLCTLHMWLSALRNKIRTCWSWPSHFLAVTLEKADQVWSRHVLCFWTSCIWLQWELDWFIWEGRIVVDEPLLQYLSDTTQML